MSRYTILIVEDSPDIGHLFADMLEALPADIELITTGTEAAQRLKEITPDLALLDLHLPGVPGDELLHQIRQDARLAHTKVIVATADGSAGVTLQEEADLVLLKPVSPSQLRALVQRLLGDPH